MHHLCAVMSHRRQDGRDALHPYNVVTLCRIPVDRRSNRSLAVRSVWHRWIIILQSPLPHPHSFRALFDPPPGRSGPERCSEKRFDRFDEIDTVEEREEGIGGDASYACAAVYRSRGMSFRHRSGLMRWSDIGEVGQESEEEHAGAHSIDARECLCTTVSSKSV